MDPRVHQEASGPPELELEAAEIAVRIRIKPDLFRGQLAVETPAFRVGCVGIRKFPKLRNSVQPRAVNWLHTLQDRPRVARATEQPEATTFDHTAEIRMQ